jgi:hypothetical protein
MSDPTGDFREEQKTGGCCSSAAANFCSIDIAWLSGRVKNLLVSPQESWPAIRDESDTVIDIYRRFAAPLALIPAVCGFVGGWAFGSVNFFTAIGQAIVLYILMLLMLYVWAWAEKTTAPKFEGSVSLENAFKHVAYSCAPMFLAGVLGLIPASISRVLALLISLYGVYIWWVGIAPMTAVPEVKRPMFLAAWLGLVIVASIVVGIILAGLSGM